MYEKTKHYSQKKYVHKEKQLNPEKVSSQNLI